jgi:hypothetical protein
MSGYRLSRWIAVALTLSSLTLVPLLAGEWDGGTVAKDDTATADNCGGVQGLVGGLSAFNSSNITNGKKTTGEVGAKWNGEQYEQCTGPQVQKENWVSHTYTRTSGNPFTRPVFRWKLKSTITVTGSAQRLRATDPQWWWDTTANVTEHAPIAEVYLPTLDVWANIGGACDPNTQASGGGADASNNNQPDHTSPFAAAAGNQNGDTDCDVLTTDAMTKVRATAKWTSYGGPCSGDNCKVNEETLKLAFEFTSWFVAP